MENNSFEIIPYVCVGNINFSDSRDVVRSKIDGAFTEGTYKVGTFVELYDYFTESNIKVLYNSVGELGAIEFYEGNIIFLDKNIFACKYSELECFFQSMDGELEIFDMGFTSHKYGIGIGYDEINQEPMSVIVFKKTYYGDNG